MASQASQIYVAKGAKVIHFDLKKDKPSNEVLLSHMLGPTGNLRAPTFRQGSTLVVGFNNEIYQKVLGRSLVKQAD